MTNMRLLLVEDNEQDQKLCMNAVTDFSDDNNCEIDIDYCVDVESALANLNESYYDGAIVDMKLAGEGNEGNEILGKIRDTFRRIPVAIMTGTPDVINRNGFPLVDIYKKGEAKEGAI